MNIYFLLYLLLVVAPIGTLIHETGHLIGARMMKADHISLSIGSGKKIGTLSFKKIQINIYMYFFLGGYVHNKRRKPYTLLEMLCIIGLGPINNGIFAAFFYMVSSMYFNPYIHILFLFNLWLALVNIIPLKIKDKQSDGYMILNLFRQKI